LADRYQIALSNQQSRHSVNEAQLTEAATAVFAGFTFFIRSISLAVVDVRTIHDLQTRRHLEHDWPTDV